MALDNITLFSQSQKIADEFALSSFIVVHPGDCLDLLKTIPDQTLQLVVTSPPYNIGKEYEKKLQLDCLSLLVKTMDFSPKLLVFGLP